MDEVLKPYHFTYLVLNAGVLFFPLVLSFDKKVAFYKKWKHLFPAVAVVGLGYIFWDIAAVSAGHWRFDPRFVLPLRLGHLPPGEILFFITVPYACLFIYECVRAYIPDKDYAFPRRVFLLPAAALVPVFIIAVYTDRGYSAAVSLSGVLFFLSVFGFGCRIFSRRSALLYLLICLFPFILANGILTALPVVRYGPEAFSGIRLFTIPLEDILYNVTLLGFELLVYEGFKKLGGRKAARQQYGEGEG